MRHELEFDIHTHVLPDALIACSLNEIVDAFNDFFPLERIVLDIQKDFNSLSPKERNFLYNGITDLIGSHTRLEEAWEIDEDSGDLSITLEGVREVLISLEVIKQIPTASASRDIKRQKCSP